MTPPTPETKSAREAPNNELRDWSRIHYHVELVCHSPYRDVDVYMGAQMTLALAGLMFAIAARVLA